MCDSVEPVATPKDQPMLRVRLVVAATTVVECVADLHWFVSSTVVLMPSGVQGADAIRLVLLGVQLPSGIMVHALGLEAGRTSATVGSALHKRLREVLSDELRLHSIEEHDISAILEELESDEVMTSASVRFAKLVCVPCHTETMRMRCDCLASCLSGGCRQVGFDCSVSKPRNPIPV